MKRLPSLVGSFLVLLLGIKVPAASASSDIPLPVPSHPRLWITTNDLPRLRSWATPTNPVYQALRAVLVSTLDNYNQKYFPAGLQNPTWPDLGDSQGYIGLITEEDAFVLALFSLIDPDPNWRAQYAQQAANLIRVAMAEAAKGTMSGAAFRSPEFAIYNRANATLETMPLAVDWVYNALGPNGQPVLTGADKRAIRDGFLTWAEQCRYASTTGGDSPVPNVVNDVARLCPNQAPYRMAANNYYLGHARLLTLMSLAIDPENDPPLNSNLPVSALTNSLRSYISIATGAWLFQEYAMFGDGQQVAEDYGLPGHGSAFGCTSGGLPPEGMLYGHAFAYLLSQLLALETAGFNRPELIGPQCRLIGAPLWDRFCDAWLSALNPAPTVVQSYLPPEYQMMGYGDILRLYVTPDFSTIYSLLMLLDQQTGIANRVDKLRWLAIQAPEGGYSSLLDRIRIPWGNAEVNQASVLYFLTLDPATLAPPLDPRPKLPTLFYDAPQGTLVAHSDWSTNQSMLHWRCSWNSINHQDADGGMFQFLRKGEFLTKEYSGYDSSGYGQASWLHNTLALQNACLSGVPKNIQWFETPLWETGSQWMLGNNAGDPATLASGGTHYVYTYGDLTPLYNRPSVYSPADAALEVEHASRSMLWIKPDHLIIYDRARTHKTGLFKRFNLCLPSTVQNGGRTEGILRLTETMASGQQLFVHAVLPTNGIATVKPLAGIVSSVAEGEPCKYRLTIEDTNNPGSIRFLHVLQGADAGIAADEVSSAQSRNGDAFEGVTVRGAVVLFPVNKPTNDVSIINYTAPSGTTNHYVSGLLPNANYTVKTQNQSGQWSISITPGPGVQTDNAGLLSFDETGKPLEAVEPLWLTAQPRADGVHLSGTGGPLLPYQVLTCSNLSKPDWTLAGSITASTAGGLKFFDRSSTNSAQRYYRLAR